jgi:uncharacterized protein
VTLLQPPKNLVAPQAGSLVSKTYWEGCSRGELLFQRCRDCSAAIHNPALLCGNCWSRNLAWERSRGTGTIYSWTLVWRPQSKAFDVPYAPIIVDLDEGWQLLSCLVGCEHEEIGIGMQVTVEFHDAGPGACVPYFKPA